MHDMPVVFYECAFVVSTNGGGVFLPVNFDTQKVVA